MTRGRISVPPPPFRTPRGGYVYFMDVTGGDVRIGHTNDRQVRMDTHSRSGFKLLAIRPGSKDDEGLLHAYFEKYRITDGKYGNSTSFYTQEVRPYVDKLLLLGKAVNSDLLLYTLGREKYDNWSPRTIEGQARKLNGLFDDIYESPERNTWYTPDLVFQMVAKVFGGEITLDPAADHRTLEIPEEYQPKYWYTAETNGLAEPWFGNCFCNPPYGKPDQGGERGETGAAQFVRKAADEINRGNAKQVILLLNAQSIETKWFSRVWECTKYDPVFAVTKSRLRFKGPPPKSKRGTEIEPSDRDTAWGGSKNGTVFVYYGPDPMLFLKVFEDIAYPKIMNTSVKLLLESARYLISASERASGGA